MKIKKFLWLLIAALACFTYSCKKNSDSPSTDSHGSANPTSYKYYITYTLNGKQYGYGANTYMGTVTNTTQQAYMFDANGASGVGVLGGLWADASTLLSYTLSLNFYLPLKVGNYQVSNFSSDANFLLLYVYVESGLTYYAQSGTINITRVDNSNGLIQGNFNCVFKYNIDISTGTYQTTNITGSFSVYRQY